MILLVGLGGAVGAILRFLITNRWNELSFVPIGTLSVNLIGSFFLGFFWGRSGDTLLYLLIGVGFLGALTTYSTLHVELHKLRENKKTWTFYLVSTYLGGIFLAYGGYLLS